MKYVKDQDYAFIIHKHHTPEMIKAQNDKSRRETFVFDRFVRNDAYFDPKTGMDGEAILRGIQFLPIDLYKSDAKYFLPEEKGIRMPFLSLAGLGDTVAQKIVEVRGAGEIFSVDELRRKAGLSKTILEMLRSYGVFRGMQEDDQFSFF